MVYCGCEYVTIQHFPKKMTWVCTSWGKFFIIQNWLKITWILDLYLWIYLGHGCSRKIKRLVQAASERFIVMENKDKDRDKETIHYPRKMLWDETEPEENKNQKAIAYLLDKLTYTVPNQNPSPLLFRLLNIIFFNTT